MFSLQSVPPGDYKLFAWDSVQAGAYQNAEFMQRYEARGTPVSVRARTTVNVQVPLLLNAQQ